MENRLAFNGMRWFIKCIDASGVIYSDFFPTEEQAIQGVKEWLLSNPYIPSKPKHPTVSYSVVSYSFWKRWKRNKNWNEYSQYAWGGEQFRKSPVTFLKYYRYIIKREYFDPSTKKRRSINDYFLAQN